MPQALRNWVEPKRGPVILLVLVAGAAGLGLTDYADGILALGVAVGLAVVAMLLREWVFIEQRKHSDEHRRMLTGLERATAASHADYQENVEQIWYIEPDGNDRGTLVYETTVSPRDSMAWRRVKVYATADLDPPTRDLMDFTAKEAIAREIEAFRVMEAGGLVDYVVFFQTPIAGGTTRQWTTEFCWPGLWNPLRRDGEDHCSLEFANPADRASIRIVFPPGITRPNGFLRRQPDVGSEAVEDWGGRTSLVWEFGPCRPGQTFRADIRAEIGKPVDG